MPFKQKGFLKNFFLLAASLSVGLAASEIVFRLGAGSRPSSRLRPSRIPGVISENVPNTRWMQENLRARVEEGRLVLDKIEIPASVNSLGFRGADFSISALKDKRVVLLIGDSCTFGVLVDDSQTFASRLQERSDESEGEDHFVVNAGVSGHNLWDYKATLDHLLPILEPDFVVVGLYMNDHVPRSTTDRVRYFLSSKLLTFYNLNDLLAQILRRIGDRGVDRIADLQERIDPESVAAVRRFARTVGNPEAAGQFAETIETFTDLAQWERALHLLDEMKKMCVERDIPMAVLLFPSQLQVRFGYKHPEPQRFLLRYLADRNIDRFDVRPSFEEAFSGRMTTYGSMYDTAHFNAYGHEIVASILRRWILSVSAGGAQ